MRKQTKTEKLKEKFIEEIAKRTGVKRDIYGNFRFDSGSDRYRIHSKKLVWRFELRLVDRWIKIDGGKFNEIDKAVALFNRKTVNS